MRIESKKPAITKKTRMPAKSETKTILETKLDPATIRKSFKCFDRLHFSYLMLLRRFSMKVTALSNIGSQIERRNNKLS